MNDREVRIKLKKKESDWWPRLLYAHQVGFLIIYDYIILFLEKNIYLLSLKFLNTTKERLREKTPEFLSSGSDEFN